MLRKGGNLLVRHSLFPIMARAVFPARMCIGEELSSRPKIVRSIARHEKIAELLRQGDLKGAREEMARELRGNFVSYLGEDWKEKTAEMHGNVTKTHEFVFYEGMMYYFDARITGRHKIIEKKAMAEGCFANSKGALEAQQWIELMHAEKTAKEYNKRFFGKAKQMFGDDISPLINPGEKHDEVRSRVIAGLRLGGKPALALFCDAAYWLAFSNAGIRDAGSFGIQAADALDRAAEECRRQGKNVILSEILYQRASIDSRRKFLEEAVKANPYHVLAVQELSKLQKE